MAVVVAVRGDGRAGSPGQRRRRRNRLPRAMDDGNDDRGSKRLGLGFRSLALASLKLG